MIFSSYTWHKETFLEIDELQCDTDCGKEWNIFRNRVTYLLHFLFMYINPLRYCYVYVINMMYYFVHENIIVVDKDKDKIILSVKINC